MPMLLLGADAAWAAAGATDRRFPTEAVGLVLLLLLAWAASHPRIEALQRLWRVRQIMAAGLPFVILGVVASAPGIDLLSADVLRQVSPVVAFALGWVGFSIGLRLDVTNVDRLSEGGPILLGAGVVFQVLAVFVALSLTAWVMPEATSWWRTGWILAIAGSMTASEARSDVPPGGLAHQVLPLEKVVGLCGLLLLDAYWRRPASWDIPPGAWVFVTLGIGASVGLLAWAATRVQARPVDRVVLLIGFVALSAGLATEVLLSPLVVCFVAGAALSLLPGEHTAKLREVLGSFERPVQLLLLVAIGAWWQPWHPAGWLLLLLYVPLRWLARGLAVLLAERSAHITDAERRLLVTAPLGATPVAVLVAESLLFPDHLPTHVITAVVGTALATEVLTRAGEA